MMTDEQRARRAESERRYYATERGREIKRAKCRRRYERHPEKWKDRARVFATRANAHAKHHGVEGKLTRDLVAEIQGPCAYCGGASSEWDHVVPLSRQGPNDPANLVPVCHVCNQSKSGMTVDEWGLMKERHRKVLDLVAAGMARREIAALVGVPIPTVSMIVNRSVASRNVLRP